MITISDQRTRGNERPFPPIEARRTPAAALRHLVMYELGYGGDVIDITETSVTVRTNVLDCVDTVTFSGTYAEMHPLVEAAILHLELSKHERVYQDALIDRVMHVTKGIPLMVKMCGGIILGSFKAKAICLHLLEVTDEDLGKQLTGATISDLLTLVELVRFDHVPLREATTALVP